MSNYRVRQVLALGPMPDRQLRCLIALATWMTDDSRTVRIGFAALAASMGTSPETARRARRDCRKAGRITYIPGSGRGHVTTWTVTCLPVKGGQDADLPSDTRKGGQPVPEKGVNPDDKRGSGDRADQQEPEHMLNPYANPSARSSANGAREHQEDPATMTDTIAALRRQMGWTA